MHTNTALVIVDLQNGFHPSDELIEKISESIQPYETVIATKFVNGNPLFQKILNYPELSKEEMELMDYPASVKIFEKTGYGLPRELIAYLKDKKISIVHVCGLETDACVLAAMYSLWDAEIQPILLKDLSFTPDAKVCESAELISKRNFGN